MSQQISDKLASNIRIDLLVGLYSENTEEPKLLPQKMFLFMFLVHEYCRYSSVSLVRFSNEMMRWVVNHESIDFRPLSLADRSSPFTCLFTVQDKGTSSFDFSKEINEDVD